MSRHCERCRRDIEFGGVFYNGHEYCTTCYQFIKGADDKRKADAARRQEEAARKRRDEALKKRDEDKALRKMALDKSEAEALRRGATTSRPKKDSSGQRRGSYAGAASSGSSGISEAAPGLASPLLGAKARQAEKQGQAPQAAREIAIGNLVKSIGSGTGKANSLVEESKKRVSDYLALVLEQEKITAASKLGDRQAKDYKARLEEQLKEEKAEVSARYDKMLSELSRRADTLGAEEFERQVGALEEQKSAELGKIEKWYSQKTGSEDKKLTETRKASSAKIAAIEKKKKELESDAAKRMALAPDAPEGIAAAAEKELMLQIQKHASVAVERLIAAPDEGGDGKAAKGKSAAKGPLENQEGGTGETPPPEVRGAEIGRKIELEMEKQARLEIGELLGKGRTREIDKKNLENLYLYALGERIESEKGADDNALAKKEQAAPVRPELCPQCQSPLSKKDKFCSMCGKPFGQIDSLHLELQKSLPVSLSQGQKEITCALLGTNPGEKPLSCTLAAALQDSKKKSLDIDISPASADMAGDSKAAFEIKFDLKDDTPPGPLTLSATLQSGNASSNAISSLSNVKTPLDLLYIKNSARLGGKLDNFIILEFDNIGDSGGMLMLASHVDFEDGQGVRKSGKLSQVVKVRGLEKGVLLLFGPLGMNQAFSGLSYSLAGVDSNGKPYKKEGKI